MKFSDLLLKGAELGLSLQNADGSFPAGHNGPYYDPETPVRNTSHFLFLYASLYERTNDSRFMEAGEKAIAYLQSPHLRPSGTTYNCRKKRGKDRCNGLVGQAWVIEALARAANAFEREDCYKLAEDLFFIHPWDDNIGLWRRVEIDGSVLTYDMTFNHQLWFASSGAMLERSPQISNRVKIFINKVVKHIQLYPDGIICHKSSMGRMRDYYRNGIRALSQEYISRLRAMSMEELYSKSVGYHAFNLYAFAMLKEAFPNLLFWESKKFNRMMKVRNELHFINNLKESEYAYKYNISGIEMAYAVETFFPDDRNEIENWLDRQMEETFLDDFHPLTRHVTDEMTAIARIYQAARLNGEYEVNI